MTRRRSGALASLEAVERAWLGEILPDPRAGFLDEGAIAPNGTEIRDWEGYVLWALNPGPRACRGPFRSEDLTKIEGYILRRRLGLDGCPASLEQVGQEVNLTREQVRKIEAAGVRKALLLWGERRGRPPADEQG